MSFSTYKTAAFMLFGAILGYVIVAIFSESATVKCIAAGAAALDLGAYRLYKQIIRR